MRIKVTSHLATLNHSAADLGILKRQQALESMAIGAGRAAVTPIEMVSDFLKVVRGREPDGAEVAIIADKLHAAEVAGDRT